MSYLPENDWSEGWNFIEFQLNNSPKDKVDGKTPSEVAYGRSSYTPVALSILIAFILNSFNLEIAELRYKMIKTHTLTETTKKYSYSGQILTTKGKSADIGAVL